MCSVWKKSPNAQFNKAPTPLHRAISDMVQCRKSIEKLNEGSDIHECTLLFFTEFKNVMEKRRVPVDQVVDSVRDARIKRNREKLIPCSSDHVPIQLNVSYSSRLLNEQDNKSTDSHGFKQKVYWSRFSQQEINEKFVAPLLTSLTSVNHGDLNDVSRSTDKITKLIVDCSLPLVTHRVYRRRHVKRAIYAKLPDDVKAARFCFKNAFDSWKRDEFSNSDAVHDNYRSKRRDYRKLLRKFLNNLETDKIKKLCVAAESNEKLFWKLLKGQRSTTQMNAFLTDRKWITDKNDIRDMWANHFEDLGKPSVSPCFDHEFSERVASRVRNSFLHLVKTNCLVL